jgi:hypothetical protein
LEVAKLKKALIVVAVCLVFGLGFFASRLYPNVALASPSGMPSAGWALHIDALKHFGPGHPTRVAHHWCKSVAGGLLECQIYDSDASNARLVEVETIVPTKVWQTFSKSEQALWHYHRIEIPKVSATLPGMPPAQQKKVVASLLETYGKLWLLWNPLDTPNNWPTGKPTVIVLK